MNRNISIPIIQETLDTQRPALQAVADAIRKQNRILLLGMGASDYLNHLFALQLRRLGWYAIATSRIRISQ